MCKNNVIGSGQGSPFGARIAIRNKKHRGTTAGMCPGYTQANVVILPKDEADAFLNYCLLNPKVAPILEILPPGSYRPRIAPGADIRRDIPLYDMYMDGYFEGSYSDIQELWQSDFVTFIMGCSFSFEQELIREGIPIRHIDMKKTCPMFKTSLPCNPYGFLYGNLIVSMRPVRDDHIERAIKISSLYPKAHGGPIQIGRPEEIGIRHIMLPDFGDVVPIGPDETPLFWACGLTATYAVLNSRPRLIITHHPHCMFITDIRINELKNFDDTLGL